MLVLTWVMARKREEAWRTCEFKQTKVSAEEIEVAGGGGGVTHIERVQRAAARPKTSRTSAIPLPGRHVFISSCFDMIVRFPSAPLRVGVTRRTGGFVCIRRHDDETAVELFLSIIRSDPGPRAARVSNPK